MTRYAIDAVTLLRLVEEQAEVHADHQLVAPQATRSQALQTLLARVQAGDLTDKDARELHTRLTETKIRALGDRMSRWTAFRLAREHGWTTLEHADYVAVTRLQADALVAGDDALARLAEGLVPLAAYEALLRP